MSICSLTNSKKQGTMQTTALPNLPPPPAGARVGIGAPPAGAVVVAAGAAVVV